MNKITKVNELESTIRSISEEPLGTVRELVVDSSLITLVPQVTVKYGVSLTYADEDEKKHEVIIRVEHRFNFDRAKDK